MEFKEILRKISFPKRYKKNELIEIKEEEMNINEIKNNVKFFLILQFCEKNTIFIPIGFDHKDEEDNEEMEYGECSQEDYMDQQ